MAAVTYKCPNCGGDLQFDPSSQKFRCEYCSSEFTEEEVAAANPQAAEGERHKGAEQDPGHGKNADFSDEKEADLYLCPSCGAEIVTDATTVATFCFYCHNPVVLQGKLSGDYRPEKIIPFAVSKKEAVDEFLKYVRKKKFIPKDFFCKEQIEKISGVYFPFWEYDCKTEGNWQGEGHRVRVYRTGDTEHTETKVYRIEREAELNFEDLTRNALDKENKQLVEAVQPFRLNETKDFKMEYLSGFQAEKRNIEKKDLTEELHNEVQKHSADMVKSSVHGYDTVTTMAKHFDIVGENWKYLLVPVWVLTYRGKDKKTYFYAMNGQTRKVSGELPVDKKKLLGLFLCVFAVVFLLMLAGGYFI